jgi:hypothetical protein
VLKFDSDTDGLINVPVRVCALAGTVTLAVPSNSTPLIVLAATNFVAENALPLSVGPINSLAITLLNVLVPEAAVTLPVTDPTRSAVIVPAANPPELFLTTTLPIILDELASTAQVISLDPSKSYPVR